MSSMTDGSHQKNCTVSVDPMNVQPVNMKEEGEIHFSFNNLYPVSPTVTREKILFLLLLRVHWLNIPGALGDKTAFVVAVNVAAASSHHQDHRLGLIHLLSAQTTPAVCSVLLLDNSIHLQTFLLRSEVLTTRYQPQIWCSVHSIPKVWLIKHGYKEMFLYCRDVSQQLPLSQFSNTHTHTQALYRNFFTHKWRAHLWRCWKFCRTHQEPQPLVHPMLVTVMY